jgi:hypothetical protein
MSFARMTESAGRKSLLLLRSLFMLFIYHDKQQLLLCSRDTAPLNLSTMDDSHFRLHHCLLWSFILLNK